MAVDAALNLSDVDDTNMAAASVTISPGSFVTGDTLAVVTAGTSIVANYNALTGVLTLTGTDSTAHYQQVLRSLTFSSTSDDPTINTTRPSRNLTYSVTDANSDGAGAQTATSTRTVSISPVNDKPTLTGTGSTRSYTENAAVVTLEPALSLADVDDTQIDQAVIRVGSGFVAGDRLNFTNQLGISGSYNVLTGTLTLTGTTTLANYQAALRSISFDSTSDNPGSGTRTIAWTVRDVNSDAAANGQQTSLAGSTSINVTPVNDNPVALLDVNSIGKAAVTPVTGNVLVNDSDVDGGILSVSGLTGGTVGVPLVRSSGTLTVNADGTYSFTVNTADPAVAALGAGATLVEIYNYTISDGQGGSATAQIRITINGANNPPVATADANNISEGSASVSAAASGVLVNDSDLNGDTLSVTGIAAGASQPPASAMPVPGGGASASGTYGALLLNPDGSYTYTLDNSKPAVNALAVGESLTDTFTYFISDGKGGTASANVVITINGTNDGPDAVNDASSLPANSPGVTGNALGNDSDPDTRDSLTVSAVNGAPASVGLQVVGTYGSITVNANGSYTFTPNTTTAKALAAGQTATDSFTYTISDGHGGTDTATITITLSGVNDAPVARPDINTLTEDQASATGNVLTGARVTGGGIASTVAASADSDPDTTDALSVTGVQSSTGSVGAVGSPLTGVFGTVTLNADGSYSYALDTASAAVQALKPGEIAHETYTYSISDSKGGTATTTLDIEIVGLNDPPVAGDDNYDTVDTAGFPGGTPISGNVLINDSDPDAGDTLTVTAVTGTAAGTVGGGTPGTFGILTLNANGTFTYNVDTSDPVVQSLLTGASLTDTYTYTVSDGHGGFATATVTFTIHGTNDAPSALNDTNLISEDQPMASGNVISGSRVTGSGGVTNNDPGAKDTDPDGDLLTVTGIRHADPLLPAGAIGAPFAGDYGTLNIGAAGDYTYTLDNGNAAVQALKAGETRSELFVYTVNDGRGSFVDATITIVITGVNDAPVAVADTNSISEDSGVAATGNVLPNDTDIDHGALLNVSGVVAGTATSAPSGNLGSGVAGSFGTLTLNADGSYSYALANTNPAVQALAAGATTTDTFTYAVTDDQGATSFTTLTITIHGLNDAPVAAPDVLVISAGDTLVSGDLTPGTPGQDVDVDGGTITVIGFSNANGVTGSVGSGSTLAAALPGLYGSLQVAADGSHSYTLDNTNPVVLALKAGQSATETYTYTISDVQGGYASSTLTITITGRNDPPIAVNDGVFVTNEDTPLNNIVVLTNDSDPDGDPLTVIGASSANGVVSINLDGTLNFVPAANFNGLATITYTISDGNGGTSTATVSISVSPVNDPPLATDDRGNSPSGRPLVIRVLDNDRDPDGDPLTITSIAGVAVVPGSTVTLPSGKVTLNADGTLSFVPNPGFKGDVLFPYEISDGHGGTAMANVIITVAAAVDVFPTAPMPLTPLWIAPPTEINPIPFSPAVFVSEVVQGFQGDRAATDPFAFSDPRAVRYGEIESQSIGDGLGFDPALFVQHAVRASQLEGAFLDNVVDGRTIRINLSSERLIPTPELALPNAGLIALQTPVADRVSEPGREVQALALTRLPVAPGHLITGSEQPAPTHRAAPSFSEQLRRSGSRTSVAGRDTLHSIRARPHV
ncbi:MAG: tandem-95 repeat protein [Propionivibrio sp.]|uniref:Tandem-95 repeat protein n=1 Tax=Candidatus Propionivibrio dominans TaxID=2954373 RepID=A0A9D7F9V2_9RHOO|nr:tandem-95 repeat protein [Candidatus Propionivibrio dominans]